MRAERRRLTEREMLLEAVLTHNPTAIVLVRDDGRIMVANRAAERLLHDGYRLTGKLFDDVAVRWPAAVRDAFALHGESVFDVEPAVSTDEASTGGGERESFHRARYRFLLNGRPHELHAIRRLTPELRRQEVAVWKRVIRTIGHEINNTLAPISSLAHSAKVLRRQAQAGEQLDDLLDAIGDSAARLRDFIASYARFARLANPRRTEVRWASFLDELKEIAPFGRLTVPLELVGDFDPAQLQQVFINLIKNATEAGSPLEDIEVRVERLTDGYTLVRVFDRGRGMSADVRSDALLPFYSTKREGSGLGLALCREIIEGHGGNIDLGSRDGGGTVVRFWLPPRS